MIKIILVLLLSVGVFGNAANFYNTTDISTPANFKGNVISFHFTDKDYHSLAGFAISILTSVSAKDSFNIDSSSSNILSLSSIGIFTGMAAGLSKEEIYDKYFGGDVEYADFVYTSYGASMGGLTFFVLYSLGNYLNVPNAFMDSLFYVSGASILLYLINIEFK